MRAVCFVKRLQWDLPGTLFRHGLTIGDVDNDGDNELVVGTAEGELYIFKGTELWQKIVGLGLITSVAIGDIFNYGRNALIVICGDGWVNIFYSPRSVRPNVTPLQPEGSNSETGEFFGRNINKTNKPETVEPNIFDNKLNSGKTDDSSGKMECVHVQRIPTNTKVVLIADVDKDGANEMIIGLTDRVVRSYRWSSNADLGSGKLVGLNKWECANQIGTVTLQDDSDGTPTLLVAQPGGTFMRIKCNADDCQTEDDGGDTKSEAAASCVDYQTLGISRMRNPNISTEILGNLRPMKKFHPDDSQSRTKIASDDDDDDDDDDESSLTKNFEEKCAMSEKEAKDDDQIPEFDAVDGSLIGGNIVYGEFESRKNKTTLLNENLITKIENKEKLVTPDPKSSKEENKTWSNSKSYALATLDGTIMLVKDEIILWSMQVDHHISALCSLDVTGDGADEIIACTWDGQTYILDQQRNSVRFQFEDPVRAFCAGMYSVTPQSTSPCLVYNNFHNKIFLYYDVSLPSMVVTALNPEEALSESDKDLLKELLRGETDAEREAEMRQLTEWLLYGMN